MEKENLKILVFSVSSWNSRVGSNTWASLLENYPPENLASICIRDEIPDSHICSRYFTISENKILKSVFRRKLATGREVKGTDAANVNSVDLEAHNNRYRKMGKKRRYSMLLARELAWKLGKWKTRELDEFLDSFKPDIILHSMDGYIHLNRITEYAIKRTGARAVGYIWDDNFTYKQSGKLGYKIYRFFQRRSLRRLAKKTDEFFAISPMTKEEADGFFEINCHLLTKPLNRMPVVEYGEIGDCIRILYTGSLYIGRDASLIKVVNAVKQLPRGKFIIDVYTQSFLDNNYLSKIDNDLCHIHPAIPQSEAIQKQREADILLFLEDTDGPNANVARLSFSTKTTDYLSSGKCILAVGNKNVAPIRYLEENSAALVASSEGELVDALSRITAAPHVLIEYAENAVNLGIRNHGKEKIREIFDAVINSLTTKKDLNENSTN